MRFAAIIAAFVAPTALAAQTREPLREATAEDMQVAHDFAACVAIERPEGTDRLLATDDMPALYAATDPFIHKSDKCLKRGVLRMQWPIVAGGLAEQRLRTRYNAESFVRAVALDPKRPPVTARGEVEAMAMCVTRRLPSEIRSLFGTAPGSPAELVAMRPIMEVLPSCLRADTAMRLNRAGLRAGLALAAYRLANAGTATPMAAGTN